MPFVFAPDSFEYKIDKCYDVFFSYIDEDGCIEIDNNIMRKIQSSIVDEVIKHYDDYGIPVEDLLISVGVVFGLRIYGADWCDDWVDEFLHPMSIKSIIEYKLMNRNINEPYYIHSEK